MRSSIATTDPVAASVRIYAIFHHGLDKVPGDSTQRPLGGSAGPDSWPKPLLGRLSHEYFVPVDPQRSDRWTDDRHDCHAAPPIIVSKLSGMFAAQATRQCGT